MTTAKILSLFSLISFIVCGICLVLAVFFWFRFDILTVIGDLTGHTARKSIQKMRENNEKTGKKSYRPSAINENRGRITDSFSEAEETETLQLSKAPENVVLPVQQNRILATDETMLLYEPVGSVQSEFVVSERPKTEIVMLDEVVIVHTDENIVFD